MADDGLCIGDSICLYSEELFGYTYAFQSSTFHSDIGVWPRQDRVKPSIPDPQVFTFEVCVANRYKLNKRFRELKDKDTREPDNLRLKHSLPQAKIGADAENEDNIAEQRRQQGKKVLYGQILQLRHVFTKKYIHVSTTQTSRTESNNMQVFLQTHNAKHSHFRIMPRYKVKAEGDIVQVDDQIVLESVKSAGQYLHVSKMAFNERSVYSFSHELNLSVVQSGFTIYRRYKINKNHAGKLRAGELVRLFHKEIEAYLVAEGLFDYEVTEDVHLRLRPVDQNNPKTMFPATSAITYWQIEMLEGPVYGGVLRWDQQCRIKHMTTRKYMTVEKDGSIGLTNKHLDPKTVFRLHPVIKEAEEIGYDTFCRIEHVLSGTWLHASSEEYKRKEFQDMAEDDISMAGLKWTTAAFKQVAALSEKQYADAFTLQVVDCKLVELFNYMAGMVPFVQKLIKEKQAGLLLDAKQAFAFVSALGELQKFMMVNSEPDKNRQKLMRNLLIVELLVQLLKIPYRDTNDQHHLTTVFVEAYDVLSIYLKGNSRKNELYIAKYIPFFQTQIEYEGSIGLNAAHMTMELIKDNRKIVDRISKEQINYFVELLKKNKNYRYLDLLNVLCVCDGVSIPDNQSYITKVWLQEGANCVYNTDLGQVINRSENVVYVSVDNSRIWEPLHEFANQKGGEDEHFEFLEHQLDLFGKLCYGRNEYCINVITTELKYLSWEEAFICLTNQSLPDELRAKYCDLIIALFVDVGENHSLLDIVNLTFVYDDIGKSKKINRRLTEVAGKSGPTKSHVTTRAFAHLRDWIAQFLDDNYDMTASLIGHNMLVEQVLRLIHYLTKYGYYDQTADINDLLIPLLKLLDGRNDKPYPRVKGDVAKEELQHYRSKGRFLQSPETKAIVDAKYRAMEILDLFFNFRLNTRLEGFIADFKVVYDQCQQNPPAGPELGPLLFETIDLEKHSGVLVPSRKTIQELFDSSAVFRGFDLTGILQDLSNYEYDYMVTQSIKLLNKFYSSHDNLFKRAVQAQILIREESVSVLYQLKKVIPTLRRLSSAKMSKEQTRHMIAILQKLINLCSLKDNPEERHPINQSILYNHGVIEDIFQILTQDVDIRILDQYQGLQKVFQMSFELLRVMAQGNDIVQQRLFDRLDLILGVQGAEPQMANALKEVFTGNKNCCMRVLPLQVQKIMTLAAEHLTKAPQFLDLMNAIVKVEELDLPLKRNQAYVMKYFMQYRSDVAFVIDQPRDKRKEILLSGKGDTLAYMIALVDMLATCAEGENRFIESICQTIFSITELLEIIANEQIDNNLKRPFLRFLLWVYLNTASGMIESGAGDLPHDSQMWAFLSSLPRELKKMTEFSKNNGDLVKQLLKKSPGKDDHSHGTESTTHHGSLHYMFEAIMPFLQVFFRSYYQPDSSKFSYEADKVGRLAQSLVDFSTMVGPLISNPTHMKTMVASVGAVMSVFTLPAQVMEDFQEKYGTGAQTQNIKSDARKKYEDTFSGEEKINDTLNMFAVNFSIAYRGKNDVKSQLGFPSDEEYTEIGGDKELPLGPEFQEHINCFVNNKATTSLEMYSLAGKLVQQLSISLTRNMSEKEKVEQEELDIKCLRLLRGIIHNEIVKLPTDWKTHIKENHLQSQRIEDVISALNKQGAMLQTLPHIAKQSVDLVREILAFLVVMLFGGHHDVQRSLIDYFMGTREETFFFAVKNRMQLSSMAAKERRLLMAQHQAKIEESTAQNKALKRVMLNEQMDAEAKMGSSRFGSKDWLPRSDFAAEGIGSVMESSFFVPPMTTTKPASIEMTQLASKTQMGSSTIKHGQTAPLRGNDNMLGGQPVDANVDANVEQDTDDAELDEVVHERADLEYKDDGYIELVLRLLGQMCDGQNEEIQDYIREQPDNIKSVNLVTETSNFLSIVYSNINNNSIGLGTQLFSTLNEFASGNSKNQANVFDNKVCDYINHILRSTQFKGCTTKEIFDLKKEIGYLMMSLMEENKGRPKDETQKVYDVSKEVMESLDAESIFSVMVSCYQQIQSTLEKSSAAVEMREHGESVGFLYFHVLRRMKDLDEDGLIKTSALLKSPLEEEVWEFYNGSTLSVELLKDNTLQKVYFRVQDKNALREEIKDKFKYQVDRPSPSDKIRNFMEWSEDIIRDIRYQQKINSHKLLYFFVKFGWWFNFFALLLSFVISLLILVTWEAPQDNTGAYIINLSGATVPTSDMPGYDIATYLLGALHNLLSFCVLISYFLSNRPSLPRWFVRLIKKNYSSEAMTWMKHDGDRESHLDAKLFSFKTLYYIMFMVLSVLGTVFYGYFFAFHLLHIASMNQLLSRVIAAVTKNGLSLIMVAILGLILFYIYGLFSFAFYRELYNTDSGLYCGKMYQCLVTLIHHGLVESPYNYLVPEVPSTKPFSYHLALAVFNVTFFILVTTIGLNIIFGIIVDTFSELRDSKWQVDTDMTSACFICSISSYDFDQYAGGFKIHVRHEHHKWSYLYFFMHLDETAINDYTALELYVFRLLLKKKYDFFPLHRALSLQDEADATDAKIDFLTKQVNYLVTMRKEEESKKEREIEMKKQLEWKKTYRQEDTT